MSSIQRWKADVNFLHKREYANGGDVVVVDCSHQCNALVLNDTNFSAYRTHRPFKHYGGHYDRLPARIVVPHSGYWNMVLDLGGGVANIRYSMNILKAAA